MSGEVPFLKIWNDSAFIRCAAYHRGTVCHKSCFFASIVGHLRAQIDHLSYRANWYRSISQHLGTLYYVCNNPGSSDEIQKTDSKDQRQWILSSIFSKMSIVLSKSISSLDFYIKLWNVTKKAVFTIPWQEVSDPWKPLPNSKNFTEFCREFFRIVSSGGNSNPPPKLRLDSINDVMFYIRITNSEFGTD